MKTLEINKQLILESLADKDRDKFNINERYSDAELRDEIKEMESANHDSPSHMESLVEFMKDS